MPQSIPTDSLYLGQTPPGDSAIVFAPGNVSLPNRRETKLVFSPNNQECLIGIGTNNTFQILYTDFYSGYWKTRTPAYFIPTSRPIEPFFSPDSLYVFITSFADIFRCSRINQTWSTPVVLDSPVNTSFEEYHPTTALNKTLYFCSNRENSTLFIFRSVCENGNYSTVEKLPDVINRTDETQHGAYDPFIAPDESYIIFTTIRPDGFGKEDQYISYHRNGNWTNPKNLGSSINSGAIEYGSYVSPDNKYYFFSRPVGWGPNAAADIYWIKIDDLIDSLLYTNFVPYLKNLIPDQTAIKGELFTFTIPDSTFIDDDGNNTLSYHAKLTDGSPLPEWLNFDTISGTFTGTPEIIETLEIMVTATDNVGASASTKFKIMVNYPVSTDQQDEQNNGVRIFPNPTSGLIYISANSLPNKTAVAEVINPKGVVILKKTFLNSTFFDMAGNPKGSYLIKISAERNVILRKFCIK